MLSAGEEIGRGLGQQVRSQPEQPLDERAELGVRDVEALRDLGRFGVRQVGAYFDEVRPSGGAGAGAADV